MGCVRSCGSRYGVYLLSRRNPQKSQRLFLLTCFPRALGPGVGGLLDGRGAGVRATILHVQELAAFSTQAPLDLAELRSCLGSSLDEWVAL